MSTIYSLSYLTCLDQPPARAIQVAAATGYRCVGIRLLPASIGGIAHRLMDDPHGLSETLAAMRDTGVRVFDLEIIRLDRDFSPEAYLRFFETGAKLGASAVLVAGDDDDESRLTGSFARACEAAAPFGLSMDLEFMPQTKVPDVRAALRVLEKADQLNSAIIVDALHFARSRSSLDDAASIPRKWMNYLQICDAPPEIPDTIEELNHTARCERLLPGEGGLDLAGLFSRLPRNLPISVEVPNDKRAPLLGPAEWARQALEATKATLAKVPGYQDVPAPTSP